MLITVKRYLSNDDATLSKIYVDGEFFCYGLEDEYRKDKVPGETRIPSGRYRITLKIYGGFHDKYKKRFWKFHKGMLWIRNVPDFSEILIHCGNTDDDTAGCLLVGLQADEKNFIVLQSAVAYEKLYKAVVAAAGDEKLFIEIDDGDRQHDFF